MSGHIGHAVGSRVAIRVAGQLPSGNRQRRQGVNPDVLATLAGRKWGIACKALHGTNPEGFLEHFRKGVDQIERSVAE
jgi:hypothetical protein